MHLPTMPMEHLTTIIIALIGGGIVGFVQFLISRHDSKQDKNSEVLQAIARLDAKIVELDRKIEAVDQKGDERNAVDKRKDILRFADEMTSDIHHSKDSWDQCLQDITDYEEYCSSHPGFKNNQAAATIEYIKRNYQERLEKHDFL